MASVLITGSSEGLGYEFARACLRRHDRVCIHGRDPDRLKKAYDRLKGEFPDADLSMHRADLADREGPGLLFEEVRPYGIDLLINNAGIGYTGSGLQIDAGREEDMILVNDLAMVRLTRLFAVDMQKRSGGTILNIASTGAFQAGPLIAEYYATKAFAVRFTRGIALEITDPRLCICCLCPGPLKTSFYAKSGVKAPVWAGDPQKTAEYALAHLKHGKILIPSWTDRLLAPLPERLKEQFVYRSKKREIRKKAAE